MSFFTALRRPVPAIPLEPPATDAVTAHRGPVDPDTSPTSTPDPSTPSRASQAVVPPTWFTPEFTVAERLAEEYVLDDLAVITTALGSPLAAAQYLYAPHLMERTRMPETTPERTPQDDTEEDAWARMEPMGDGAELLAMMSGDDKVIAAAALRIRNDLARYPADVHAFLGEIYVWLLSWTGLGPADDPGGEYADALLIARSYPEQHTPQDDTTEKGGAE